MDFRYEKDSMGRVRVPAWAYWGAQTQRSYENFPIGEERMPDELISAYGAIKYTCAQANSQLGVLDEERSQLIEDVAYQIYQGQLNDHFPLSVWQTGSGTQTNMNANEVIANKANEEAKKSFIHPNDHVNMSQSSNDTFPTAIHLAALGALKEKLLPALKLMSQTMADLENANKAVHKTARTHLQDAVPMSFGQEISAWRAMVEKNRDIILTSMDQLRDLPLGGTAVGTGLNAPPGFDQLVVDKLSQFYMEDFRVSPNKFRDISGKTIITSCHGQLKTLATDLIKIANDVRLLSSGPRAGLGEISIPANEPGSSIMPGKVNPTQAEALSMACVQVIGNDVTLGLASSQGNLQLNVHMPVIIYNYLQSVRILADSIISFTNRCLKGLRANREVMKANIQDSLMVATALNRHLGYDQASQAVNYAHEKSTSLKEACLALAYLTEEEYEQIINIERMVGE